jgi:methylated-DNA-[protein]-cysteine S-methyltransferase
MGRQPLRGRLLYHLFGSPFGDVAVVCETVDGRHLVRRVYLPCDGLEGEVARGFPTARPGASSLALEAAEGIAAFLEGEDVQFSLNDVALASCSGFQQRVLVAEHGIPRGSVSAYGDLAAVIGAPGAARAVGRALSTNPFPVIVPCHRAIRRDGTLGGFQGGADMKRALLEFEGVEVSPEGRAVAPTFHYRPRGEREA